ncbi:hypothetical protein J3A83DRAFT_4374974 [Scleroderma citrinum]
MAALAEFVIKKRRKRAALDIEHTDPRDLVTVGLPQCVADIEDACEPLVWNMTPDITILPDSKSSFISSHATETIPATLLTVEDFLNEPAKNPPRVYRRRLATAQPHRQGVGLRSNAYKLRKRRDVKNRFQLPSTTTSKTKKMRLMERLYRAVVLTHGDPSESIQDPDTLTPRPLTFVTINKFTTPPRAREEDDIMIDESYSRNDMFSSKTSMQRVLQDRRCSRRPVAHRPARPGRQADRCSPLDFVPVTEAEAAYSQLFLHSRTPKPMCESDKQNCSDAPPDANTPMTKVTEISQHY